ncbi:MAG: hypothetical protein AAF787_25040, partial [Chloroflexota bacterium]
MHRIAIATESKYVEKKPWDEDGWLKAALEGRGHTVDIIDWMDDSINVQDYDAIFVSSTWNIPDAPSQFEDWLKRCEIGKPRLINPYAVLAEGIKKYDYMGLLLKQFGEVESDDGSIVPTRFYTVSPPPRGVYNLETLNGRTLEQILETLDKTDLWRGKDIVLKPATSADGKHTYVYNRSGNDVMVKAEYKDRILTTLREAEAEFDRIMQDPNSNGIMVQVYMPAVENGEYSLTFFDGQFSHAVQKPPGFRADNSNLRRLRKPDEIMLAFAMRAIQYICDKFEVETLTRCRVDLFYGDNRCPILCELEFVDPNMNIKRVNEELGEAKRNEVVSNLADAIERRTRELASA